MGNCLLLNGLMMNNAAKNDINKTKLKYKINGVDGSPSLIPLSEPFRET